MVKLSNLTHDEISGKTTFEIEDVSVSIINGIRRSILTNIEVVSMIGEENSTINMLKNTGPLNNEIMTHRVCLIPIHMSDRDTDEYDNNEPLELELNEKNSNTEMKNITSKHFKGKETI